MILRASEKKKNETRNSNPSEKAHYQEKKRKRNWNEKQHMMSPTR